MGVDQITAELWTSFRIVESGTP